MQKKTKRIIILAILLLITISIILILTLNKNQQIPQPLAEQAKAQYETQIGNQTYDITNAVLEPNAITPTISAGMIPIKWDGANWIITTREDTDWYDYANGKPAYIMLNDGYYKSEIEQGIAENRLMENNVGVGVPDDPNANIHTRHNLHMDTSFCLQRTRRNPIHRTRLQRSWNIHNTRNIYLRNRKKRF